MKIGRPMFYIPSPMTISRDVKVIFACAREDLSQMLQVSTYASSRGCILTCHMQDYPGRLHFATDAWSAPNHRPFVAFTVHLEYKGAPLTMLLDIVEVARVHLCCGAYLLTSANRHCSRTWA